MAQSLFISFSSALLQYTVVVPTELQDGHGRNPEVLAQSMFRVAFALSDAGKLEAEEDIDTFTCVYSSPVTFL